MRSNDPRMDEGYGLEPLGGAPYHPFPASPSRPQSRARPTQGGFSGRGPGSGPFGADGSSYPDPESPECRALARCIAEALHRTVLPTEEVPTHAPPRRAIPIDAAAVVIVPATNGDANATTAVTRLEEASGYTAVSDGALATLVSVQIDQPMVGIVEYYGVEAEGREQMADLDFSLLVGERRLRFPSLESLALGGAESAFLVKTFAIAQPGERVLLQVTNNSALAPHIVMGRIKGFAFPVNDVSDSLRSMLLGR